MQKEWTFDDLPVPDVTLDLYYNYSYTPGKFDGPFEGCYPDDVESEIALPRHFVREVMNAYLKAAREAMKQIEDQLTNMQDDNLPRQWAEEDREAYEDAKGEAQYEAMREREREEQE